MQCGKFRCLEVGVDVVCVASSSERRPLSEVFPFLEPWTHLGLTIFGYWAGNFYVKTERRLVKEINEIRADKGLPTMVGSHNYKD